jgi:hypothetical protein
VFGSQAGGRTGLHHGFRDIFGAFENTAHIDPRAGCCNGAETASADEIMFCQFNIQNPGQFPGGFRRSKSSGEDHHIELLGNCLGSGISLRRNGQSDLNRVQGLPSGADSAQTDPVSLLRTVVVKFVVFSEGAHIHIKYGGFNIILESFLGNDGFFKRIHAAYPGTIGDILPVDAAGTDTLDPGDPSRLLAVTGPQEFTTRGAGSGHDALIFEAGDHVGIFAMAKVIQATRVVKSSAPIASTMAPTCRSSVCSVSSRNNGTGRTGFGQCLRIRTLLPY